MSFGVASKVLVNASNGVSGPSTARTHQHFTRKNIDVVAWLIIKHSFWYIDICGDRSTFRLLFGEALLLSGRHFLKLERISEIVLERC